LLLFGVIFMQKPVGLGGVSEETRERHSHANRRDINCINLIKIAFALVLGV
jgi:hypothetical protein